MVKERAGGGATGQSSAKLDRQWSAAFGTGVVAEAGLGVAARGAEKCLLEGTSADSGFERGARESNTDRHRSGEGESKAEQFGCLAASESSGCGDEQKVSFAVCTPAADVWSENPVDEVTREGAASCKRPERGGAEEQSSTDEGARSGSESCNFLRHAAFESVRQQHAMGSIVAQGVGSVAEDESGDQVLLVCGDEAVVAHRLRAMRAPEFDTSSGSCTTSSGSFSTRAGSRGADAGSGDAGRGLVEGSEALVRPMQVNGAPAPFLGTLRQNNHPIPPN